MRRKRPNKLDIFGGLFLCAGKIPAPQAGDSLSLNGGRKRFRDVSHQRLGEWRCGFRRLITTEIFWAVEWTARFRRIFSGRGFLIIAATHHFKTICGKRCLAWRMREQA